MVRLFFLRFIVVARRFIENEMIIIKPVIRSTSFFSGVGFFCLEC